MKNIVTKVISLWHQKSVLNDNVDEVWDILDEFVWNNALDVLKFNSSVFFVETLLEEIPANTIHNSFFNQWRREVNLERFNFYQNLLNPLETKLSHILRDPLISSIDPFWLCYPNNINLKYIDSDNIAMLSLLSGYSSTILSFEPLSNLLYVYGNPIEWVESGSCIDQAEEGLKLLEVNISEEFKKAHSKGTFQ